MSNSPLNTFETFQTGTDINSQLTTIMKLKKENHLLGQSTINKVESKSRKEHLIIDLRKDCEYYELEQVKMVMNSTDLLSRKTALSHHPFVDDAEEELWISAL